MDRVYSSAYITISAAASRSSNGRLFTRGSCLLPFHTDGEIATVSCEAEPTGFAQEPLYSRGWTLKEHLLSPRLLIFTTSGMVWQCDRVIMGKLVDGPANTLAKVYKYRLPGHPVTPKWSRLIEFYCSQGLRKPADKFHAITAFARRYHQGTSDRYLAGL